MTTLIPPTLNTPYSGDGTIQLFWSADNDNDITNYYIHISKGETVFDIIDAGTNTSFIVSTLNVSIALVMGEKYTISIVSYNGTNYSALSNTIDFAPYTEPDAPTLMSAVPGNGTVTLTWTAPEHNGGRPIEGYVISYNSGGQPVGVGVGADERTYIVSGLTNGTEYNFSITAESLTSGIPYEFKVTPAAVPTKPILSITGSEHNSITLLWESPNNGGNQITNYIIKYTIGNTYTTISINAGLDNTYTITNLIIGTQYHFTLIAINGIGSSIESDIVSGTPTNSVPSKPVIKTIIGGNGNVILTWDAPNDGGSQITRYIIKYRTGSEEIKTIPFILKTTYTVPNLINGILYNFILIAVNDIGSSIDSDIVSATPNATVPSTPTIRTHIVDKTVTLTWDAPNDGGSTITGYIIKYRIGTGNVTSSALVTGTTYTVSGLTNKANYLFYMAAINSVGSSNDSAKVSVIPYVIVPDAPHFNEPIAVAIAETIDIILSWTTPNDNESPIIGYTIRYGYTGGITSSIELQEGNSFSINVLNRKLYSFYIIANNINGSSINSNIVTFYNNLNKTPESPTIQINSIESRRVSLSWNAPNNGGSPITGYIIKYRIGSGNINSSRLISDTSYIVSGLISGTTYNFSVYAINNNGNGDDSNTVYAKCTATTITAPKLKLLNIEGNKVTLSWDSMTGINKYIIKYWIGFNDKISIDVNKELLNYTINGLTYKMNYSFTILSYVDDNLFSNDSNIVVATPDKINIPIFNTPLISDSQITLTWNIPYNGSGLPIKDYTITYGVINNYTTINVDVTTNTFSGLTNGIRYSFIISVNYGTDKNSGYSSPIYVVPFNSSDKPTITTIIPGYTTATLTWEPSTNNGGSPILGYIIKYKTGLETIKSSPLILDTKYTVTGLINNTTYSFTVLATTKTGNSNESDPKICVPIDTVPSKPLLNKPIGNELGNISLSWDAPIVGPGTITEYIVNYRLGSGDITHISVNNNIKSYRITELTVGTSYLFSVTAKTNNGYTIESDILPCKSIDRPGEPTNIRVFAGYERILIMCDPPEYDGGSPIIGYGGKISTSIKDIAFHGGNNTIMVITDMFESYTVNNGNIINCENSSGKTSFTSLTSLNVRSNPFDSVLYRLSEPTVLTNVIPGDKQVTLVWKNNSVTTYIIGYNIGNGDSTYIQVDNTTSYTIHGLTNGVNYTFKIICVMNLLSADSNSLNATPIADSVSEPPILNDLIVGDRQITLSWIAPNNNGGHNITNYFIKYDNVIIDTHSIDTSFTISNLTNNIGYTFSVIAQTTKGNSYISNEKYGTPRDNSTVPDAPTLNYPIAGYNQVTLTWNIPINNSGSPITGYTIKYITPDNTISFKQVDQVNKCIIDGLTNEISYLFSITANNSNSSSNYSNTVYCTPSGYPSKPTLNIPSVDNNQNTILSWDAPIDNSGASITGYTIYYKVKDSGSVLLTKTVEAVNTCIMDNLNAADKYLFYITANNLNGASPSSNNVYSINKVPDKPVLNIVSVHVNDIQLSWDTPINTSDKPITGYTIYYKIFGNYDQQIIHVGLVNTYTLTNLSSGIYYEVYITADVDNNASLPSNIQRCVMLDTFLGWMGSESECCIL